MEKVTEGGIDIGGIEDNGAPKVSVNGKTVKFESELVERNNDILASAREICDAVGAEFHYEADSGEMHVISIVKGTRMVTVINGFWGWADSYAEKWRINRYGVVQSDVDFAELYNYGDGDESLMKTEPEIIDGRIYLPVKEVFEYLGAQAEWIPDEKTVELKVYDTSFSRSVEDINRDKRFMWEQAVAIFCNLSDVKGTDAEESVAQYGCGFGFNQKGKVYGFCNTYNELIYIYSDGTVTYADESGNKINEISVNVPVL